MHLLVAAYLGYEAPEEEEATSPSPQAFDASAVPWLAGMGAIPASPELRDATDPMQGLAALERMFFGEVKRSTMNGH